MYFPGRWVPMDRMNTLFVVWGISVVLLGALIWWLRRKTPPARPRDKPQPVARRRKYRRRKA